MPAVTWAGRSYDLLPNESVLDGLLRNGIPASHSCKAGSCGSCMLRAACGTVPDKSQTGLKDAWKAQGYFLSCICFPETSLEVAEVASDLRIPARIRAITPLARDVLRVTLRPEAAFDFHAGQFLTLIRQDSLARSYSVSSLPRQPDLELHVRLIPGGKMSAWLADPAVVGAPVQLQGPSGDCFYVPGRPEQPILLAGTGTGLAPLWAIAQDALLHGHTGPIHLFHGALRPEGLYFCEELHALAARHPNFTWTPTVAGTDGPIDAVIAAAYPDLSGWRGFACGDPTLVRSLKRKFFLAGMAMKEIYADAFLPAV